ncbi:UNVERIFIED_CONTAM: hypothetical protein NCL1_41898 [Trichonephila clavipes]
MICSVWTAAGGEGGGRSPCPDTQPLPEKGSLGKTFLCSLTSPTPTSTADLSRDYTLTPIQIARCGTCVLVAICPLVTVSSVPTEPSLTRRNESATGGTTWIAGNTPGRLGPTTDHLVSTIQVALEMPTAPRKNRFIDDYFKVYEINVLKKL